MTVQGIHGLKRNSTLLQGTITQKQTALISSQGSFFTDMSETVGKVSLTNNFIHWKADRF